MKTILVAEDREASRELIRTLLEHSGYRVLEAANGAEAIELAREANPDLLLLDLHMPVMDGFQVVRTLRAEQRFEGMPIVALTASAMHGDRERALADGFTSYLSKPLSLNAIRKELVKFVGQGSSK